MLSNEMSVLNIRRFSLHSLINETRIYTLTVYLLKKAYQHKKLLARSKPKYNTVPCF